MPGRFEGKVAIVTGSSSGIGRATAVLFAQEGAKVTISGRSEESIKETRRQIIEAGGKEENIHEVRGNMLEEEVQKKLVDETVEKFGQLDILVNNAGAGGPDGATQTGFDDGSLDIYDYTLGLNTRSIVSLTKLALPHLIKTQGEIVMVSSICGLATANVGLPYYGMSKAALDQLTRALSVIYIKQGVRVNSVNPGPVYTDIMTKMGMSKDQGKEVFDNIGKSCTAIGRSGDPKEIAAAIAFLADRKASSFVIGHCLVVDGGASLLNALMIATVSEGEKLK